MEGEYPLFLRWRFLDIINTRINIHLEMPQKAGKKVGIHFYENVLAEMNLPLLVLYKDFTYYFI